MKNNTLSDNWKFLKYKKGGTEFLRVGQKIAFQYFSQWTHEVEKEIGSVIDRTYHAGHYLVENSSGTRFVIYNEKGKWFSSDNG